jgi:hypothetical protein
MEQGKACEPTLELDVKMLSGRSHHISLSEDAFLYELRCMVQSLFAVPLNEQSLYVDAIDPSQCFPVQGGDRSTLKQVGIESGMSLRLLRQDPRTASEKNCVLLDALQEGRVQDALDVMGSSGFPIDPNCVRRWQDPGPGFLSNGRDFHDVRESADPALSLAIKMRKTWNRQGEPMCDRINEADIVLVVEELLHLKADPNSTTSDILTCGSWGSDCLAKSPAFLAVETCSPTLLQILLEAGADPEIGTSGTRGGWNRVTCEDAAQKLDASENMKREILTTLRNWSPKSGFYTCSSL